MGRWGAPRFSGGAEARLETARVVAGFLRRQHLVASGEGCDVVVEAYRAGVLAALEAIVADLPADGNLGARRGR